MPKKKGPHIVTPFLTERVSFDPPFIILMTLRKLTKLLAILSNAFPLDCV